jgi:hypothetical protein
MRKILFAALLSVAVLATAEWARAAETATVFPMSSVEHVDVRNQMLTFKTKDGRLWLMRMADPVAIRRMSLVKGDLVSIEVDLDDQIIRVARVGRTGEADR